MVTALTVSRQFGSLGGEIVQEVASRLGYRAVHHEFINQAARRAGAPEMALATIDDLGLLHLKPSAREREAYHQAVQQVVEELAAEGDVVIVGRGGQVILRDHSDVLHVRIIAPPALRAERVARSQAIALAAAQAQVGASDRSRREYVGYYGVDWDDPHLYDLVINTGRVTPELAVSLVCLAVAHR